MFHDRDDEEFDAIYNLFGGECKADQCDEIKRFYRNRDQDRNQPEMSTMMQSVISSPRFIVIFGINMI